MTLRLVPAEHLLEGTEVAAVRRLVAPEGVGSAAIVDVTRLDAADRARLDDGEVPRAWIQWWEEAARAAPSPQLVRQARGRGVEAPVPLDREALPVLLSEAMDGPGRWVVVWGVRSGAAGVVRCARALAPIADGMGVVWWGGPPPFQGVSVSA